MSKAPQHHLAPSESGPPVARRLGRTGAVVFALGLALCASPVLAQPSDDLTGHVDAGETGSNWSFDARNPGLELHPPGPANFDFPLVLDDNSVEGEFGFDDGLGNARQFLWFNQFDLDPLPKIELEEIWVFFSPGPNIAPGAAIDLVVYHDVDDDPTNGADVLAVYPETIQTADGIHFSIYPLPAPLTLPRGGDVLVGVIPRFIESGVTSPTNPAALDTTASQGQSWVALWTGDPPASPDLPSDQFIDRVDVFVPGNWAIRAFGSVQPVVEVPTLGQGALAALALLLVGAAAVRLRRS